MVEPVPEPVTEARPSGWSRSRVLRAIVVLCVLAFLTFARGLGLGFAWDDHRIIEHSPRMHELSSAYQVFVRPSTWIIGDGADSPVVTYRPLALASMALDWALFGGDPAGFHLTSLLLHVACVAVFLVLLQRLGVGPVAAMVLGMVFAVHPVGAEAITWINGRSEPLCLLFGLGLLALCAGSGRLGAAALAGIAAAQCLSLLGKETGAIFLPLALWILWRSGDRERLARGAAAVAAGAAVYAVLRLNALAGARPGELALGDAVTGVPGLWFRALQFAFVPVDLGLENLLAWSSTTSTTERVLFVALAVVMVAATLVLAWRRRTLEALGLAWWLAALLPAGLVQGTGGYWPGLARWVYVALPGLLITLAPLFARVAPRALQLGAAVVALVLVMEAQDAIALWRDDETLLRNMIAKYPSDGYAYLMLARDKLREGDAEQSVRLLREGRKNCGPKTRLTCIEGVTLAKLGRCQESALAFSVGPDCLAAAEIDGWEMLGVCYANQRDFARARDALGKCKAAPAVCQGILAKLPP